MLAARNRNTQGTAAMANDHSRRVLDAAGCAAYLGLARRDKKKKKSATLANCWSKGYSRRMVLPEY